MTHDLIKVEVDGVEVTGKFLLREKYGIKVEILSPYKFWQNSLSIPTFARTDTKNYLTEYGLESAKFLLTEDFRKIVLLDKNFYRILEVYTESQKQKKALEQIDNAKIIKDISMKIDDWFFDCFLRSLSFKSGISYNVDDRKQIDQIFSVYRMDNNKIYLRK
jgi:hypothetical protein